MARDSDSSTTVSLFKYAPEHAQVFKALNEAWIRRYFVMETGDYKALDHPDDYIIKPGGHIVMASLNDEIVGTCALIKMSDGGYELAKMAVDDKAQGCGIGLALCEYLIDLARTNKATRLYLESNTKLVPAINLYRKVGFVEIPIVGPGYDRVDIQMELLL